MLLLCRLLYAFCSVSVGACYSAPLQARGEADIKKWLDSDDLFDIAPPKKPSTDACADKSILAWMAEFQIPVTEPAAVVVSSYFFSLDHSPAVPC